MPFRHLSSLLNSCIPTPESINKCEQLSAALTNVTSFEGKILLHVCSYLEPKDKFLFRSSTQQIYMCSFGCPIDLSSYNLRVDEYTYRLIAKSSWIVTDIGMMVDRYCTSEKVESFFQTMGPKKLNINIRRIEISSQSTVDNVLRLIERAVDMQMLPALEEISLEYANKSSASPTRAAVEGGDKTQTPTMVPSSTAAIHPAVTAAVTTYSSVVIASAPLAVEDRTNNPILRTEVRRPSISG
jgi:hypothetical protein